MRGGYHHSEETKEKIRNSNKKTFGSIESRNAQSVRSKNLWEDPEYRSKTMLGIKERDSNKEYKENRCALSKKLWEDPGYRKKVEEAIMRPEARAHHRELAKAQWSDTQKRAVMMESRNKPETKAKQRAAANRPEVKNAARIARELLWSDPEYREKFKRASKEFWNKPENKEKLSKRAKAQWENPEVREKMRRGIKERWSDPEVKKRQISAIRAAANSPDRIARFSGENNPAWKGGISYEPYCPKFNKELKNRVRAFFDYECVICGRSTEENGRGLACHHVEYNKSACCDGKPVRFAALCSACHARTNHNREQWENMLHRIIEEIYHDRSYFTKDEWSRLK